MRLILASTSAARRTMLANAGLTFTAIPPDFDEDAAKADWSGDDETLAAALAFGKAATVSSHHPDALVIGADQLLVCDGVRYDKPKTLADAANHLHTLSGRPHTLITSACILRAGTLLWSHIEKPRLLMRSLTAPFIQTYLAQEGESICLCVGAYRLEGRGITLFESIEGDHFSILGLPLLALLRFLRKQCNQV